jgi:hypothetical protein
VDKETLIKETQERYPFLTGITYSDQEFIGIVINHDNSIMTFYDLDRIQDKEIKKLFLELGEVWWWESNRQLPIDVFLHHEMQPFKKYLRTFIMKDIEIIFGPTTSLQNLIRKRIKRRGIQLIRKID